MPLDLSSLEQALDRYREVVARSSDERFMSQQDDLTRNLIRAGVIQHFEIVYELCWKFIQRWLRLNLSPEDADFPRTRKELFRSASRAGLISDPNRWFAYSDSRNLTTHTYDQSLAESLYAHAKAFSEDAFELLTHLQERND